MTDCYAAVLNLYEPGDRIFLFGFSRGAYTARCVANVITLCGIPSTDRDGNPLPKYRSETRKIASEAVVSVYEHGAGLDRKKHFDDRREKAKRFRIKYGSGDSECANVYPYFVGVFDTVASLGAKGLIRGGLAGGLILGALVLLSLFSHGVLWMTDRTFWDKIDVVPFEWSFHPFAWINWFGFWEVFFSGGILLLAYSGWRTFKSSIKYIRNAPDGSKLKVHFAKWKMKNYDRGLSTRVGYTRHAIAIDETRADFPRVKWGYKSLDYSRDGDIEPFVQLWFAGNHSDIGGSYPEPESRLSDLALQWMLNEALSLPNPLLVDKSKLVLFPDPGGMQHCEVDAVKDTYFSWLPEHLRPSWKEGYRHAVLGATLHPSVAARFNLPSVVKCGRITQYRPETLRQDERFAHLYEAE